jgi:hypothetical protein
MIAKKGSRPSPKKVNEPKADTPRGMLAGQEDKGKQDKKMTSQGNKPK